MTVSEHPEREPDGDPPEVTLEPAGADVPAGEPVEPEAHGPVASEPVEPEAPEPVASEPPAPAPSPAVLAAIPSPAALAPPRAEPAAGTPAETAPPAEEPASDPAQWGRVGDDGTVFVRTVGGERAVGSYPGADAAEALAYFGRKFDELAGQVRLLEQRVVSGGVSLQDAGAAVEALRLSIVDAHAVGDLDGLLRRLDDLTEAVARRQERRAAERAKARERATAAKERLVAEAESLAESRDWKKTGERMRTLLEEWKAAPRLDRKADDALWKRFSAARTAFDRRRRVHFAELDEQRGEIAVRKEKLVKEAESLAGSKEWRDTAKKFRDLMDQWKAAGRARRDVEDALWARFRAAQDTFFAARNEVFAARDADLAENLEKTRALVAEAEAVLPVTDYKAARAVLRSVHERWEAVGHVPRGDRDQIEGRLRRVDEAVRAEEDAAWARSNPEARARAEATVSQLRASIAALEKDAAAARAAGDEKKAAAAEEAAAARGTWLAEAEKTLAEFS